MHSRSNVSLLASTSRLRRRRGSSAAAANPNTNLEAAAQPATAASMCRFTGTFVDPSHEPVFAAQLFRMTYPTYVLLMAFMVTYCAWNVLVVPDIRAFWVVNGSVNGLGLLCRVLLHRNGRHDPVRSQWMGSSAWILLAALYTAAGTVNLMVAPVATCEAFVRTKYTYPFVHLCLILVNSTIGLGFACKFALIAMILIAKCVVWIATCHDPELDPWLVCTMGVIVLGSAATHTAELFLRRSYAEKVQAKMQEQQSRSEAAARGRQLEVVKVRNEQLQAEKERLMYDMQRRGHPIDDDNRSAIRRGLQAGPDQPHHPGTSPSEVGGPAPSGSPPPSLPPGPPSSTADSSSTAPPPDQGLTEGAGARCNRVEIGASPPVSEAPSLWEVEEALAHLIGDEEVVLGLQSSLSPPSAQAGEADLTTRLQLRQTDFLLSLDVGEHVPKPANVADVAVVQPRVIHVQPRVIAHRVQEAVDSRPQGQGVKRERQESRLLVGTPVMGPPVAPSCCDQLPGSLDHVQGSRTSRQQALHVARQSLRITSTEFEIFQICCALAIALGSVRTELGTIKAVHAVLLLLDRPGMSDKEAYTYTGASMSNFKKWRKRVLHAQLGWSPPP
jgi:hypothetical protein